MRLALTAIMATILLAGSAGAKMNREVRRDLPSAGAEAIARGAAGMWARAAHGGICTHSKKLPAALATPARRPPLTLSIAFFGP